ncbi:MAG: LPS export ABC transporter permease LptF [Proteobacteria bacterium]|nr:LPS export ABC transporter permease LptF [Pseudomonadota bacterium]
MGTVDRYVLREVGLSWLAVTGVLLAILVSNQLAQVLGQAAERGYPREVILGLIGLMSIQNGTYVIPVGLLLGIVLALGRLYHESEMAALRACGVGPAQLLRPVSVLAVAVAALLAWLALAAAPRSFERAQAIQREAIRAAEFGMLEPGKFHTFARGSAVFYAEAADSDGTLRRVFLQRRVADRVEIVLADRARHLVQEGGALHVLVLQDGERYEVVPGDPAVRRVHFAEHGIPVRLGGPTSGPARVETRPTLELMADPERAAQAEFQRRVSLPLMALVLALLAVPLSELRPRQGRYARIGLVILVYFVYANLLSAAQTWIEKGWVAPQVGVWWTHALVLCVAGVLWWRHSPPRWASP